MTIATSPAPSRPRTPQPSSADTGGRRRAAHHLAVRVGDPEQGSLMLYMVPISFVLLLFAGLVFDGGNALAARGRAADVAAQAARAGADALTAESLRTGGPVNLQVDPVGAQQAGQRVLTAAGATGTIRVEDGDVVRVSAHVRAHTAILSAIGVDDLSDTATATAIVLHGVRTPTAGL